MACRVFNTLASLIGLVQWQDVRRNYAIESTRKIALFLSTDAAAALASYNSFLYSCSCRLTVKIAL